jgi:hypothetical protein
MKLKLIKVLTVISAALYATAFLIALVSVFFRGLIFSVYGYSGDAGIGAAFPLRIVLELLAGTLTAAVIMLIILKMKPTRRKTTVLAIIMTVFLILQSTLILPAFVTLLSALEGRMGIESFTVRNIMNAGVSAVTNFFTAPAWILMILAIGGWWGSEAPAAQTAPEPVSDPQMPA